jgi:hypothetical protein
MPDVLGTLNQVLADRPFLEGEEFTVGDVAVGAYLLYIPLFFPTVSGAWMKGRGKGMHTSRTWTPHSLLLACSYARHYCQWQGGNAADQGQQSGSEAGHRNG